jgi:hypothetical protein
MVATITMLDVIAARSVASRHRRKPGNPRRYSDRSGFPGGLESARNAAGTAAITAPKPSPKPVGKRGQVPAA